MNANTINQLEAEISMCFPLGEGLGDQYVSGLIADAINGVGSEYMEIGYELSAMHFDDALCFLPVFLLGELRLFAEGKLDQCFICVVYLVSAHKSLDPAAGAGFLAARRPCVACGCL